MLLANRNSKVIVVAGGGKFADAVRHSQKRLGFDDACAHKMALLAMEQYAHSLAALTPELHLADNIKSIHRTLANNKIVLWLPYKMLMSNDDIPASWDVTSDSLAAWLAIQMQIRSLLLVKSIPLPANYLNLGDLADRGLVDPFLLSLIEDAALEISWLQKDESTLLADILQHKPQVDAYKVKQCSVAEISRTLCSA